MGKYIIFSLFMVYGCNVIAQERGYFIDDRDQIKYKTVTIGNQIWMAENLAFLPKVSESGEGSKEKAYFYVYGYAGSSVDSAKRDSLYLIYGVLYNWVAAKTACPEGWHLPSDEEWQILEEYLGVPKNKLNDYYARGDVADKLKKVGFWKSASGSSGFNALPSGARYYGDPLDLQNNGFFGKLGNEAFFWTSSSIKGSKGRTLPLRRQLRAGSTGIIRFPISPQLGYCVRCIKD